MRDHAIVSPHFWTGETGRFLRKYPDAQRVALYLMTCPSSNMIGLYYLPIPLMCHELGMTEKGAIEGLRRASEGGFCTYDAPSETVFVRNMARYQLGERLDRKDNRRLGVIKMLAQMKNSPFYNEFIAIYGQPFHLDLEPLPSPYGGGLFIEQDQEKDKEKEQDLREEGKPLGNSAVRRAAETDEMAATAWPSPEQLFALYNDHTPANHPKVTVASPERTKKALHYLRMFPDQAFWLTVFGEVSASAFLQGEIVSKDRRAVKRGLDWLMEKGKDGIENCVKTYEGKYRNDKARASPQDDTRLSDKGRLTLLASQRLLARRQAHEEYDVRMPGLPQGSQRAE